MSEGQQFAENAKNSISVTPEAIERMASAAAAAQGWRWNDFKQMVDIEHGSVCARNRHSWRQSIRAALASEGLS